MNKTMTSLVALGVGAMAYNMTRSGKNNMISGKSMKKARKRIMKAFS